MTPQPPAGEDAITIIERLLDGQTHSDDCAGRNGGPFSGCNCEYGRRLDAASLISTLRQSHENGWAERNRISGLHAESQREITALRAELAAVRVERDEQAIIIAGSVAKTRLIEAEVQRDAAVSLLVECRKWQAEGEFGDPLGRKYWSPQYEAFMDQLDAAIDRAKGAG